MGELKPCPFCGGEAKLLIVPEKQSRWIVRCQKCFANHGTFASDHDAVEFWNRRVNMVDYLTSGKKISDGLIKAIKEPLDGHLTALDGSELYRGVLEEKEKKIAILEKIVDNDERIIENKNMIIDLQKQIIDLQNKKIKGLKS